MSLMFVLKFVYQKNVRERIAILMKVNISAKVAIMKVVILYSGVNNALIIIPSNQIVFLVYITIQLVQSV